MEPMYLSIQQKETGRQIKRLLSEHGYTVKDVQTVMGFENPQAVYKMDLRKIAAEFGQFYNFK